MGSIEHEYQAALRTINCNGLSAESEGSERLARHSWRKAGRMECRDTELSHSLCGHINTTDSGKIQKTKFK